MVKFATVYVNPNQNGSPSIKVLDNGTIIYLVLNTWKVMYHFIGVHIEAFCTPKDFHLRDPEKKPPVFHVQQNRLGKKFIYFQSCNSFDGGKGKGLSCNALHLTIYIRLRNSFLMLYVKRLQKRFVIVFNTIYLLIYLFCYRSLTVLYTVNRKCIWYFIGNVSTYIIMYTQDIPAVRMHAVSCRYRAAQAGRVIRMISDGDVITT